jgi:hypothetical protein
MMTEEEFFMGLAETTKAINIPDAGEICMWVAAIIFALSICTISYVALGDAWKEVRRRFSQRVILTSIRHHKTTPPPKRK